MLAFKSPPHDQCDLTPRRWAIEVGNTFMCWSPSTYSAVPPHFPHFLQSVHAFNSVTSSELVQSLNRSTTTTPCRWVIPANARYCRTLQLYPPFHLLLVFAWWVFFVERLHLQPSCLLKLLLLQHTSGGSTFHMSCWSWNLVCSVFQRISLLCFVLCQYFLTALWFKSFLCKWVGYSVPRVALPFGFS